MEDDGAREAACPAWPRPVKHRPVLAPAIHQSPGLLSAWELSAAIYPPQVKPKGGRHPAAVQVEARELPRCGLSSGDSWVFSKLSSHFKQHETLPHRSLSERRSPITCSGQPDGELGRHGRSSYSAQRYWLGRLPLRTGRSRAPLISCAGSWERPPALPAHSSHPSSLESSPPCLVATRPSRTWACSGGEPALASGGAHSTTPVVAALPAPAAATCSATCPAPTLPARLPACQGHLVSSHHAGGCGGDDGGGHGPRLGQRTA